MSCSAELRVEHEKSFIISGPGSALFAQIYLSQIFRFLCHLYQNKSEIFVFLYLTPLLSLNPKVREKKVIG